MLIRVEKDKIPKTIKLRVKTKGKRKWVDVRIDKGTEPEVKKKKQIIEGKDGIDKAVNAID